MLAFHRSFTMDPVAARALAIILDAAEDCSRIPLW
jgi:hypothetical protein